ncbi:hypothetical protein AMK06_CH02686 [Rhizobium sp. N541]|nr:hypothetical protein AMK05_CH02659 [Rhizobium sp. N324]ANM17574.1 hypothetical protein AMK06_CH02686 [Rhizobium sp. N541]ANM23959.1 hypothetical protein AMK07_CH02683 [Rhizobium sp. N941]OYD04634.1 hypothetical protein AMK08_CH102678 [Rhizobium sp. N4311]
MDNMAAMQQPISLPSRYFWRRFVAFALDLFIFQAAILISVHCISTAFSLDLRFARWTSMECTEKVPDQLAKRIETGWPLNPNELRTNEICEVRQFPFGRQRYLRTTVLIEPWDYVTPTQVLTIPVDTDDNPVTRTTPSYSNLISGIDNTVLIALAFACFSAKGRRTFGKAVFFLRVTSVDGKGPDFVTALKREILKCRCFRNLAVSDLSDGRLRRFACHIPRRIYAFRHQYDLALRHLDGHDHGLVAPAVRRVERTGLL